MSKIIVYIIFILFLFSCNLPLIQNKVEIEKYRDINNASGIKINSLNGNVEIIGWSKNYIEINAKKILLSGLPNDIKLMKVIFEKKDNDFIIETKIPARVHGEIELKIYIPFMILKLYLNTNNSNISIIKYLGIIELINNSGNINIDFQGELLRINSNNSKINLNIKSKISSDIVVNNEDGNIKLNLFEIGKKSFIDLKSKNGNIFLNISGKIPHEVFIINKNKYIMSNYKLSSRRYLEGAFTYLYGKKDGNDIKFFISNINGKINLQQIN